MDTYNRDDRPTIAEVAALTRRLRELSGQGRDADPAERAAFLVEKDALLARIVDSDAPDQQLHQHRAHLDRADGPDDVAFDADDSQWWHPGGSARLDLPHPDVLPPWERPPHAVDPTELAARAAALREQTSVDDAGPQPVRECERPIRPGCCVVVDGTELAARREQLARWHDQDAASDASAVDQATETCGFMDPPYGDSGWSR